MSDQRNLANALELITASAQLVLLPRNAGSFSDDTFRISQTIISQEASLGHEFDAASHPQTAHSLILMLHEVACRVLESEDAALLSWQRKVLRADPRPGPATVAEAVDSLLCHGIDDSPLLHLLACRVVFSGTAALHQLPPQHLMAIADALSGQNATSRKNLAWLLGQDNIELLSKHSSPCSASEVKAWRAPISFLCDAVHLDPRVSGDRVSLASSFLLSRIISEAMRAKHLAEAPDAVEYDSLMSAALEMMGIGCPSAAGESRQA